MGNTDERPVLCREWTVSRREFFCAGRESFTGNFHGVYVKYPAYFYGLSLLERFAKMGKKRLYMIFSLTDETYSLFFVTKVPKDVEEGQFLFAIALLDQLYWIIGSAIGALLGSVLPIDTTGIDFAMTALFVVIMVEQWMESKNRPSVLIGLGCGLVCLLIFGADNFILPTMICIMLILLPCSKFLNKESDQKKEVEHHAG